MRESGKASRTASQVTARGYRRWPGAVRVTRRLQNGFTLMELVVVILIIGLLVSLAVPSYKSFIMKSRRTEAKQMLFMAAQRQQQWFTQNNTYTTDMTASGLNIDATSSNGYYTLSIAAGTTGSITTSYSVSATAVSGSSQAADTACGTFSLNSLGQRSISGSQTQPPCW
jgi:type IV pilus assembly protein PilE